MLTHSFSVHLGVFSIAGSPDDVQYRKKIVPSQARLRHGNLTPFALKEENKNIQATSQLCILVENIQNSIEHRFILGKIHWK